MQTQEQFHKGTQTVLSKCNLALVLIVNRGFEGEFLQWVYFFKKKTVVVLPRLSISDATKYL